ncbi:MAG: DNA-protecting protein DprA [Chloroflexi bacterium]|nr:DNA-processing protein DprA [Chloroflexota bacterium]MQC26053.1 DNA-protecting protein DprA [Chloroflexota bacterium]
MNEQHLYWIALSKVPGIGPVRFKILLDAFGDVAKAWKASPTQLRAVGLPADQIEGLIRLRKTLEFKRLQDELKAHDVRVLTWEDAEYPRRLKDIGQSPPVIYLRGQIAPEDEWAVAVVGTRSITKYGRQISEELGIFLAQQGITVVSGLARGVDATVQRAALDAGGRSIAVLAHGLDRIYPAEHRGLAQKMLDQGALISDYAIGVPPESANFPPRNRIISGLSIAVVVIEAGKKSGAKITAEFAAEQGRDVFAVPGPIHAVQSKGTNQLIRDGAYPLLDFEQLLQTLDLEYMTHHKSARVVLPADATEAKLFEVLGREPLHVDEIRAETDLPIEQVSSTLALMELKGMVRLVGGMNYVAVREANAAYHAGTEG